MEKLLNLLLDLPKTVNEKLPMNSFNKMMDDSEGSMKNWTGTAFKVGALVLLIVTLTSVVSTGMDAFQGSSGLGQVSAILCFNYDLCSFSNCSSCKICGGFTFFV